MWWETKAWSPLARQKVCLSSAPQARTWRGNGQGSPSGRGGEPPGGGRGRPPPPGAAQAQPPPPERPHHRVVGAHVDGAVVGQEPVGDPAKALDRLAVQVGDRLAWGVSAGAPHRPPPPPPP